ncbi:hypothetical protein ACFQ0M_22365 [Kitasatospora aburaviensis]
MTTRAQAIEAAHRWINGELPSASADGSTGARRVHSHEFDLGWVLWAEPSPVRVDPLTGERRAPRRWARPARWWTVRPAASPSGPRCRWTRWSPSTGTSWARAPTTPACRRPPAGAPGPS